VAVPGDAVKTYRRLVPLDEAIINAIEGGAETFLQVFVSCCDQCSPFLMERDVLRWRGGLLKRFKADKAMSAKIRRLLNQPPPPSP